MPSWDELSEARNRATHAREAFNRVMVDADDSPTADATAITGMAVMAICLELRALGMTIHRALQETHQTSV